MDAITSVLVPIHKEGHKFILIFAAITLLLFLLWEPLGWLGVILTAWCAYFFRDPDRLTPAGYCNLSTRHQNRQPLK